MNWISAGVPSSTVRVLAVVYGSKTFVESGGFVVVPGRPLVRFPLVVGRRVDGMSTPPARPFPLVGCDVPFVIAAFRHRSELIVHTPPSAQDRARHPLGHAHDLAEARSRAGLDRVTNRYPNLFRVTAAAGLPALDQLGEGRRAGGADGFHQRAS